ncbi:MAG: hypothetical protein COS99_07895 [Candidatus Omnitrophica bacterium CG07_land_8_20_14_0_80_42_15]|uniref:DUF4412 domain-containing protein n=1 Tax=Candidatus Aquitaenariimonas noxiae TaxID=1974741 RepID=A0A2J0KQT3_9BACT|nr:MAG: hypothetical protein COS99_07895 [Candidatus Omnitrophica bacterium CG07_land_8_20_14_0_80_42_15]
MKKIVFITIASAVILYTACVWALEFSADMVTTTEAGTFEGKIFVSNNKMRTEMPQAISIVRFDKQITWVIMPEQKMYMEQTIDPKTVSSAAEKVPGEIERTALGDETVDGRSTTKYKVVYTAANTEETVLQWIDKETSIPIKVGSEDGTWLTEYRNLKVGPQPDSLFEMPEGYAKFNMPNMQDIQKMMGNSD